MALRRFWSNDESLGSFGMRILERFRAVADLLDLDSVRVALRAAAAAPPAANNAAPRIAPNAAGFSPVPLSPLAGDDSSVIGASFLSPESGGSFIVLYQQGDLFPGGSVTIDADTRQVLGGGATDPANLLSGHDDQLVLGGGLTANLGGAAAGHEKLVLMGGDNYNLSASDSDVDSGGNLVVWAGDLGTADGLVFDGSAETDGRYTLMGGHGSDQFIGGSGNDQLLGSGGADSLTGGAGADTFHYSQASDSTGALYDSILDFQFGADRIDLPVAVTGFDAAIAAGTLSEASFDADLTAVFGAAALGAGHAAWFTPNGGDLAGQTFLIVDGNGIAGYQPGQDYVIHMAAPPPVDLGVAGFFV
jgi:Ca2+-binding RTX toxin-like protein